MSRSSLQAAPGRGRHCSQRLPPLIRPLSSVPKTAIIVVAKTQTDVTISAPPQEQTAMASATGCTSPQPSALDLRRTLRLTERPSTHSRGRVLGLHGHPAQTLRWRAPGDRKPQARIAVSRRSPENRAAFVRYSAAPFPHHPGQSVPTHTVPQRSRVRSRRRPWQKAGARVFPRQGFRSCQQLPRRLQHSAATTVGMPGLRRGAGTGSAC